MQEQNQKQFSQTFRSSISKSIKVLLGISVILLLMSSCTTISYSPKVSLDVSPKTVKKTVMVEKFKDISPEEDRENPLAGLSATNEKALVNDLDMEVTNAVVSDFAINGVFNSISRRIENPDYIMKGEIKKFMGISELNGYAKFSYAALLGSSFLPSLFSEKFNNSENGYILMFVGWIPMVTWYFGVPIRDNEAEVEITISLYDKSGNIAGTYIGKADDNISNSMYTNNAFAVPSQTNKVFSKAIAQIREQILADISKLEK